MVVGELRPSLARSGEGVDSPKATPRGLRPPGADGACEIGVVAATRCGAADARDADVNSCRWMKKPPIAKRIAELKAKTAGNLILVSKAPLERSEQRPLLAVTSIENFSDRSVLHSLALRRLRPLEVSNQTTTTNSRGTFFVRRTDFGELTAMTTCRQDTSRNPKAALQNPAHFSVRRRC